MHSLTHAYKGFTHNLRSPVQGGDPIWDGTLPYRLPCRTVDQSSKECAAGWNACRTLADVLQIAGFWPGGRPSRAFAVRTRAAVVERENKLRASTWEIVRECEPAEIHEAIGQLSAKWFGDLAAEMAAEQTAWREVLARPLHDPAVVEAGLRLALEVRRLQWTLRRFDDARAARAARDARAARAARAAGATRDAWAAWAAWAAGATRDAWAAWAAWAAWGAWGAWDAWDARDARDALTVYYAARRGWISHQPNLLSIGLRDAYRHGLAIALPTRPDELGWAMEDGR